MSGLGHDVYGQLTAKFDRTYFRDGGGNTQLEYLTGEQVISRLNDVLGPFGWSFEIKEHGLHLEADEIWALGRLTVYGIDGQTLCCREQMGSQKLKRPAPMCAVCGGKANNWHDKDQKANPHRAEPIISPPLDIGFDLKGAATDAMKKCASLIGVGLYLSEKDGGIPNEDAQPAAPAVVQVRQAPTDQDGRYYCADCEPGTVITSQEVEGKKGKTTLSAKTIADQSFTKFGRALCLTHAQAAKKEQAA